MPRPYNSPLSMSSQPSAKGWALPTGVIALLYLATFLVMPHDGFWINDNGCKFIQLQAMVRSGYTDFSIPWPTEDVGLATTYNPIPRPFGHIVDGKLYATFSPVFPLLSSFPYRLFGPGGLYILPFAAGILVCPAIWSLVTVLAPTSRTRRIARPLALGIAALGTPMWFYSMTFWEHVPAVCLATWAVACCLHFVSFGSIRRLAIGAVLCGLAVYFRDELYLLGVILAALVTAHPRGRWRSLLLFAGIFVLTVAPLWGFQWAALGHPFGYHFRAGSAFETGLLNHLNLRWEVIDKLLLNCHENGWLSAAICIPGLALLLLFPRVGRKTFGRLVMVLAGIAAIAAIVVMSGFLAADSPIWWSRHANGLFAASPILVLALVRAKARTESHRRGSEKDRHERALVALWLVVLLYVVLYVLFTPRAHASGIHWGCRYLLPVVPLMSAMAAVTLARWLMTIYRGMPGRALLCLTLALMFAAQVYSLTLLRGRKSFSARLNRAVAAAPQDVIVASGWYIPQELAQCFFDKRIFLIRHPRQLDRLSSALRDTGEREVLLVVSPPTTQEPPPGGEILHDGVLSFISVELRPLYLSGPPEKTDG